MIKSISIENFKAFGAEQRLPIKPLTFVYGANSSGKSSVIHSLLFARQALETKNLDVHYTTVGGDSVDLGGFRQYVHQRQLTNNVTFTAELDCGQFTGRLKEIFEKAGTLEMKITIGVALDSEGKPQGGVEPRIRSYELLGDGDPLLRMSPRADKTFRLDRFETGHPIFAHIVEALFLSTVTTEELTDKDKTTIEDAVNDFINNTKFSSKFLLPSSVIGGATLGSMIGGILGAGVGAALAYGLKGVSKQSRQDDLKKAASTFLPSLLTEILQLVEETIIDALGDLFYLGPLRSFPPRHLVFAKENDANWFAGGGYAWDEVRKDADLREKVNNWLSAPDRLQTRYQLRVRNLLTIDDLRSDFYARMTELQNDLGDFDDTNFPPFEKDLFGEEIPNLLEGLQDVEAQLSDIQELNLVDMRSDTVVSHRDVGIGVSQVLPVLVSAYASKEKIIAIEQPEIHLHPALQADLSDVFIESALGENKNRFIIESHSEHLLLRVMKRMRQTFNGDLPKGVHPVTPEDVMILFVEPDGSRSVIREMPLDKRGELVNPWPGGFFEEGFEEMF
jgi:hypothetical protein